MIITNKKNLPDGIVEATKRDYYSKGEAKFSVTGLLVPPQIRRLMSLYNDKLTVDASDEIWKLFGSAVHHILDRATKSSLLSNAERQMGEIGILQVDYESADITAEEYAAEARRILNKDYIKEDENVIKREVLQEERLYLTVGDIRISGAPDWYNITEKKVEDYKVTTVYKVTKGDRSDWEAQLNVYALLLTNAGYSVDELQVNAILKDFSRRDAQRVKGDEYYPDCPVATISIPLWRSLDTLKWLIAKIEDQMKVEELQTPEEVFAVRPCSLKDKWQKPETYALMKKGNKRATSIYSTKLAANTAALAKSADYYVEVRKGEAIRCEEYCLVKDFCHQYKVENNIDVTYEEMKSEALKQLEEIVPETNDKPDSTEEIDKAEETGEKDDGMSAIPSIPEVIKPKKEDTLGNINDLMDKL